MDSVIWAGWAPLLKTLVVGPLGYLGVVVTLRTAGKRALSKLNMFDFVVTIAMGSILASLFMGSIALVPGLFAFALLIGVQALTTWATSRSEAARRVLMAESEVLFLNGEFRRGAMRRCRVTESELEGTARDSSVGSLDRVAAMVLETDGTVSVIPKEQAGDLSLVTPGEGG